MSVLLRSQMAAVRGGYLKIRTASDAPRPGFSGIAVGLSGSFALFFVVSVFREPRTHPGWTSWFNASSTSWTAPVPKATTV